MYKHSNCQIAVKLAKVNNSYSGFCAAALKHLFLVFVDDVRHRQTCQTHGLTKAAVTFVCFNRFN